MKVGGGGEPYDSEGASADKPGCEPGSEPKGEPGVEPEGDPKGAPADEPAVESEGDPNGNGATEAKEPEGSVSATPSPVETWSDHAAPSHQRNG